MTKEKKIAKTVMGRISKAVSPMCLVTMPVATRLTPTLIIGARKLTALQPWEKEKMHVKHAMEMILPVGFQG